jgi:hypothetical protein
MDFQGDELGSVPIDLDIDPIVLGADGTQLTVLEHDEAGRAPDLEEALLLVGVHTYNFANFISEQMFKVWACMRRPGFESVSLVVDEKMPPQLREVLEFFVGPDHPIVVLEAGASVKVGKLWTCSTIAYRPAGDTRTLPGAEGELSDAPALAALLRNVDSGLRALERPDGGERLYVTRGRTQFADRSEVEMWFSERGYQVVDFADLSFAEQVKRVRNAEFVVIEEGSSAYYLLFARPGARIGVLTVLPSEAARRPAGAATEFEWRNEMARALGHRMLLYPGELINEHPQYDDRSEFRIDLNRLPGFLDELAAMT